MIKSKKIFPVKRKSICKNLNSITFLLSPTHVLWVLERVLETNFLSLILPTRVLGFHSTCIIIKNTLLFLAVGFSINKTNRPKYSYTCISNSGA